MRSAISMFFKIEKGQTEQHKLLILCIKCPDSVNHCANSMELSN